MYLSLKRLQLVLLFCSLLIDLQAQKIGMTSMRMEEHLPSLSVTAIFQDAEGYMWFGSEQGITRFDAYSSQTFKLKNEHGVEVSDQGVTAIREYHNKLLLATKNGLYVLDKSNFSIVPFRDQKLNATTINSMLITSNDMLWVGTGRGIYIYDANFQHIRSYLPENSNLPKATSISDIFEDKAGTIWVATWEHGLRSLDKRSGKFKTYPPFGNRNNPFKLFQDNRGQLWVCTWGDGLFLFDPSNTLSPYTEIRVKNKRRKTGKEDLFYNIVQDKNQGYIWVLSFSGISAFTYNSDGKIQEADVAHLFSNTSNIFNDIHIDNTGHAWLAIEGQGVSSIGFDKPAITPIDFGQIKKEYGISPNLNMLYRDRRGHLWFNLERLGLGKYSPATSSFETYSNSTFKDLISIRAVKCMIEHQEKLWIGSSYESSINLFKRSGETLEFERKIYLDSTGEETTFPQFFFADSKENLWIATSGGLFIKENGSPKVTRIRAVTGNIAAITEDNAQNIWVATHSAGIYRISMDDRTKPSLHLNRETTFLQTDHIEALDADAAGNLWIGTKDGRILFYHTKLGNFEEYANRRLFHRHQLLDVICFGNDVWISTPNSIYRLTPKTKEITEYTAADGLFISLFTKRCYTVDEAGQQIYFGGYNGIISLSPSPRQFAPHHDVKISDIHINNRSVLLHQAIDNIDFTNKSITLNPEEGNIELNFSSLEYHHRNKIRYAYKLVGVDKDWVYAPLGRYFATYSNLDKGTYTFLIKATNLQNQWSDEWTEFTIIKKPAFYESNVAYLIYIVLISGLAYYIIRFSLARLKLKNDLKIVKIEKEKTDELVQAKLSYFTNISHDLLTPLTVISCLVDDIQITSSNRNNIQFDRIRINIDRLKRLLKQILDFRRVENKQMHLQISVVDISAFIHKMCDVYFMPIAIRKRITFEIEEGVLPLESYLDIDKLDKVIFNLLSNAFKYTPEEGHIHFKFYTVSKGTSTFLILEFTDSGIGIHQNEIEKIFVPFYTNKQHRSYESNGIGLALTKELVELHGGTLGVESELGKGTSFTVSLPIDKAHYANQHFVQLPEEIADHPIENTALSEEASAAFESVSHPNDVHLLLVEDNEELLLTLQSVLKKKYRVSTSRHGQEALSRLEAEGAAIDIVVSDIMMPFMDGLALCTSIKSNAEINHIPVILLTAKNNIEDQVAAYNAGADGYIGKPFDLKVLEARINSFLINKRTTQQRFKNDPQINLPELDYTPIDQQFLGNITAQIEQHLMQEDFDAAALADKLGLSKSTLYRKTKTLLNLSPSELIKNIRLKHAYRMIEQDSAITISEIAFAVGFSDPRYFSTCFKAEFGITPTNLQKQSSHQH